MNSGWAGLKQTSAERRHVGGEGWSMVGEGWSMERGAAHLWPCLGSDRWRRRRRRRHTVGSPGGSSSRCRLGLPATHRGTPSPQGPSACPLLGVVPSALCVALSDVLSMSLACLATPNVRGRVQLSPSLCVPAPPSAAALLHCLRWSQHWWWQQWRGRTPIMKLSDPSDSTDSRASADGTEESATTCCWRLNMVTLTWCACVSVTDGPPISTSVSQSLMMS